MTSLPPALSGSVPMAGSADYSADADEFLLAVEALRIRNVQLFDGHTALYTSDVVALPHHGCAT